MVKAETFIARQPIFDKNRQVVAYELLYRDNAMRSNAVFFDGDKATSRLLSDAVTVFGLSSLTNSTMAFVNFTNNLLLSDFAYLADPKEVVIEILEDVEVNEQLLEKLTELKERGYQLALDDYVGDSRFEPVLALADVLKVDFMLTDAETQARLAKLPARYPGLQLLAEKVETQEEFERAVKQGYTLFQGYYLARPKTMRQRANPLSGATYAQLWNELSRPGGIDFTHCASLIYQDASMRYRLIRRMNTTRYYRGNRVDDIRMALMLLGEDELRRWFVLVLASDNSIDASEELIREAFLRGSFAQQLIIAGGMVDDHESAFLMGMFSMLDQILGLSMEQLLRDLRLPKPVREALLGDEENLFARLLRFVSCYEKGEVLPLETLPELRLDLQMVSTLYMKSVVETDAAFRLCQ